MSKSHLDHIKFDFIRYANCWEDVELLIDAFNLDSNSTVISIASGGDNCFSLAAQGPKKVIAVDISQPQLYLVELKMVAIAALNRKAFMQFAGFIKSNDRADIYNQLRQNLSENARKFWDDRIDDIEEGIIHIGKFERYFQLFKPQFLHSIHEQEVIDGLFATKSADEQEKYYKEAWYDDDWQQMHSTFFSEDMLGEKGRDPEFTKQFDGSVADLILEREIAHLKTKLCQNNQFLFYILNNKFDETHLPHYVRAENYDAVKSNLDKIILECGLLGKVEQKYDGITHLNLSNIFEYMDMEHFHQAGSAIIEHAEKGAKLAYWNFMVPRNLVDIFPNKLTYNRSACEAYSKRDKGYFYRCFVLNEKK